MAIYILGASRRFPSDKVLEAVVRNRTKDSDGRVFEIITLTSLVNRADFTSTHGFQDALIHTENGRIIEIEYRDEGRLEWITPEFGGDAQAQIPKTPKNMNVLASCYYDGIWSIDNPMIEAEVKGIAERMRASMAPEQVEKEKKRIELIHTDGSGGRTLSTPDGLSPDDPAMGEELRKLERQEEEIRKKKEELRRQKEKLSPDLQARKDRVLEEAEAVNKEEKELLGATTDAARAGKPLTLYGQAELSAFGVFKLRQIARKEFKIHIDDKEKKVEIVEKILAAQDRVRATDEVPQAEETLVVD